MQTHVSLIYERDLTRPEDGAHLGSSAKFEKLRDTLTSQQSPDSQIAPTFDAAVSAQAQLDILITPQVSGTLTFNNRF